MSDWVTEEDNDFAEDYDRHADAYEQGEPPQPEFDDRILDSKGNEIKVGDNVIVDGFDGPEAAVVTGISDWDGDADDYGQTIVIPPAVEVKFVRDAEAENYPTVAKSLGGYGPQLCEEVTIA
jgi:uncharacterized protein involved in type VI secretion and phage assembly